jgi:hypothetical protein
MHMPATPVANLPFHARVAAIARWEQRCARAGLRQAARYGDQWLREELAHLTQANDVAPPARPPARPKPRIISHMARARHQQI